ncbi:MAG: 50S ribosomal protein L18 [Mycoplasmataceae bacterium]|jgi:large subunit ribosomal protein L18|nr:50S ribosomal protein L18 [Mycoplasmataceae bacterium]
MKSININRKNKKNLRRVRFLKRIKRNGETKPRFIVSKSNANIFAQIFNDQDGTVIVAVNSIQLKKQANIAVAKEIGTLIAEKALKSGVDKVVFDRAGNKFHGQIKAVADAAREKGLIF